MNALEDAENFAMEMLGEFFAEIGTGMDDFKPYLLENKYDIEME
jgi:hypothetical protein